MRRPLSGGRFAVMVAWRLAAFVALSLAGPWIAKTIQEISQAADGVSGDIRKVNHAAQNTSTAATETSSSAGKLAELAITAQRVVERFKV